jgi:hypothetical protein
MEVNVKARDGILIGQIFPVGTVESEPLGREAVHLKDAPVSEVPQNPVGLDNVGLIDQQIHVSRRTQTEIAEDGLRERQALQNTYRDVVALKFSNDTPEFGQ